MRPASRMLGAAAFALACGGAPPPAPAPAAPPRPATRAPVEAEPDDGVEVTSTKGHLEPAAVNAGLAPHRARLSGCYTQNVGKRRWLGGHLLVRWEIATDGTVTQVLLADSDLGAWPIERCVLEVAREASFGKPIGGAAELTVPLDFTAPNQPPAWDMVQSAKAVGGQLTKLNDCAEGAGDKRPEDRPGKRRARGTPAAPAMPDEVAITLYVGPHGRAASVGFASASAALDDGWAACAEKAALAWRLPDPKGQVTKLAVRYRPR